MTVRRGGVIRLRPANPAVEAPATPADIFGAALIHEWDMYYSTIGVSTGISSVEDIGSVGGVDITQGTAGLQPVYNSDGEQSDAQGDGSDDYLSGTGLGLSGGDYTFLCVVAWDSASPSNGRRIVEFDQAAGGLARFLILSGSRTIRVTTPSGSENLTLNAVGDTDIHALFVRSTDGLYVKAHEDGSGAEDLCSISDVIGSINEVGVLAGTGGSNPTAGRFLWGGIVAPTPPLDQINTWGDWAAARFGNAWSAAV